MAPKDDNNKTQQQLYLHPQVSFEDELSFSSSSSQDQKHPRGWKSRLVNQIKRLLGEEETTDEGDDGNMNQLSHWGSTAIMTIAVFSIYKLSKNPRVKQRLWPFVLAIFRKPDYQSAMQVSLSLLRSAAVQGMITKALIGPSEIVFQDSEKKWKRSQLPPNSHNLQSDMLDLLARHGCTDVSTLPETFWSRISGPMLTALPFVYLALVYKIFKNIHGDANNSNSKLLDNDSQTIRFSDVAGLDPIIGEVTDIVSYLKNPIHYLRVGAQPPRGILLHGPPGSGKTLLAQALAGEGNCDAFVTCSGSDFCEMYVGRGAARVRTLFQNARTAAIRKQQGAFPWLPWKNTARSKNERPPTAIIFIDELDALAKSRSFGGATSNDERDQTLNQLLTEMDGFPSQCSGVTIIMVAATNRADVLDPAILRRFDRQIHVPYPDRHGRRDILKIHARRVQCNIDEINWEHLASREMTGEFSGSDLRNVVNDAALLAVRDRCSSVKQSHLLHAVRRARAMKANAAMGASTLWSLSNELS